jgi:hypothetical protein
MNIEQEVFEPGNVVTRYEFPLARTKPLCKVKLIKRGKQLGTHNRFPVATWLVEFGNPTVSQIVTLLENPSPPTPEPLVDPIEQEKNEKETIDPLVAQIKS